MRKFVATITATAMMAASLPSSPVFAQTPMIPISAPASAPVDQVALISSTIKAFPNGGEPLKLAITDLIVKHPSYAANLVTYVKHEPSLTPEQKEAIIAGLADALQQEGVVAQAEAGGLNPAMIALLLGLAAGVGLGIYALTKNKSCGSAVSPNC
jgi:hypothetical protein